MSLLISGYFSPVMGDFPSFASPLHTSSTNTFPTNGRHFGHGFPRLFTITLRSPFLPFFSSLKVCPFGCGAKRHLSIICQRMPGSVLVLYAVQAETYGIVFASMPSKTTAIIAAILICSCWFGDRILDLCEVLLWVLVLCIYTCHYMASFPF